LVGGEKMSVQSKRVTFVITPEIDEQMKDMKREVYFDCTRSEMIRELVAAGVHACRLEKDSSEIERKNA